MTWVKIFCFFLSSLLGRADGGRDGRGEGERGGGEGGAGFIFGAVTWWSFWMAGWGGEGWWLAGCGLLRRRGRGSGMLEAAGWRLKTAD